jgi:hypothetical protein
MTIADFITQLQTLDQTSRVMVWSRDYYPGLGPTLVDIEIQPNEGEDAAPSGSFLVLNPFDSGM